MLQSERTKRLLAAILGQVEQCTLRPYVRRWLVFTDGDPAAMAMQGAG